MTDYNPHIDHALALILILSAAFFVARILGVI